MGDVQMFPNGGEGKAWMMGQDQSEQPMKCSISGESNTACGRGGKRAHVPLPAADESETEDVRKNQAAALCATIVKSRMEAGEESFS